MYMNKIPFLFLDLLSCAEQARGGWGVRFLDKLQRMDYPLLIKTPYTLTGLIFAIFGQLREI